MSSISFCPKCSQQVSLPLGTAPIALVRCPLCHEEYTLREALDRVPPLLIVVSHNAAAEHSHDLLESPAAERALADMASDELEHAGSLEQGDTLAVAGGFAAGTAPLDLHEGSHPFRPDQFDHPAEALHVEEVSGDEPELELDTEPFDEAPSFEPESDHGDFALGGVAHAEMETEPAIRIGAPGADTDKESAKDAKPGRRKKRERSAFGKLVGTVIGLLITASLGGGLALMIVMWVSGKGDFHVAGYLPGWMVPEKVRNPESAKKPDADKPEDKAPAPAPKAPDQGQAGGNESPAIVAKTDLDPSALTPVKAVGPDTLGADDPPENPTDASASGAAKTSDAATSPPGLREPVSYTADDLGKAVKDLKQATADLAAAPADDKDAVKKAKARYYRQFYRLAEVVTFTAGDPAEPSADAYKEEIQKIARDEVADDKKLDGTGRAASQWLGMAAAKRGEHQGVLLAGTVKDMKKLGRLYELRIELAGDKREVSVLSAFEPRVVPQDRAIVLGSIVDDPADKLEAYEGPETTIVWNGLTLKK